LYSIVIVVFAIRCETEPCWLGLGLGGDPWIALGEAEPVTAIMTATARAGIVRMRLVSHEAALAHDRA
jgi:hypothetical protein